MRPRRAQRATWPERLPRSSAQGCRWRTVTALARSPGRIHRAARGGLEPSRRPRRGSRTTTAHARPASAREVRQQRGGANPVQACGESARGSARAPASDHLPSPGSSCRTVRRNADEIRTPWHAVTFRRSGVADEPQHPRTAPTPVLRRTSSAAPTSEPSSARTAPPPQEQPSGSGDLAVDPCGGSTLLRPKKPGPPKTSPQPLSTLPTIVSGSSLFPARAVRASARDNFARY